MGLIQRLLHRKVPQKPTPVKPVVGLNCSVVDYTDLDHLQILKVRHVRLQHDLSDQHSLGQKIRLLNSIEAEPLVSTWNLPIDWKPSEVAGCIASLAADLPTVTWQLDQDKLSVQEYGSYYRAVKKSLDGFAKLLPTEMDLPTLRVLGPQLARDSDTLCVQVYVDDPDGTLLAEEISTLRQSTIDLGKNIWITSFGSRHGTPAASEITAALQTLPIGWRAYYHALRDANRGETRLCPDCVGKKLLERTDGSTFECPLCNGRGFLSVERGLISFENQTCFPAFHAVKDWITPERQQARVRITD